MAREKKKKEKKKTKAEVKEERTYNIPLRKEFLKVPRYKRAKKAVSAVRKFLSRHMKSDKIKIGKHLNLKIWQRGIKNPPHHIEVSAKKDSEGIVFAELPGIEEKKEKAVEKTKEPFEATQEELKKGEKAEELQREIEKEATMKPEKKAEEEEVKETIKELKGK